MKKKKFRQDRKRWFRIYKCVIRLRYRKPDFEFLGEKPTNGAIILSNHDGAAAPLNLEVYADFPIRMWGVHEMNSGLINLYKYQTRVYYHQKKHWNLHLARLFCLIASPLTNLFYKGLKLISTYTDMRFITKTIKDSVTAIEEKGENIVIFPEVSTNGYLKELEGFYGGFTVLAKTLLKRGTDVKIFVSYFKKAEKKYIFDKPVLFSELKALCNDRHEMAKYLLTRCNELGM